MHLSLLPEQEIVLAEHRARKVLDQPDLSCSHMNTTLGRREKTGLNR